MCRGQCEASVINWIKLAQSTFCNSDVQECPWKMSASIHLNIWPAAHCTSLPGNHSLGKHTNFDLGFIIGGIVGLGGGRTQKELFAWREEEEKDRNIWEVL